MPYVPHTPEEQAAMLAAIGVKSMDDLFADIPPSLLNPSIDLPEPLSELELMEHMRDLEAENRHPVRAGDYFMGGGAYNHHVPAAAIALAQRGEFLTAYTPYQAEISQGLLQAIFEYQTAIARITALDAANASLYDGGTALYEACAMAVAHTRRHQVVFDTSVNPHYREVLASYGRNARLIVRSIPYAHEPGGNSENLRRELNADTAAVIVQYPDFFGRIADYADLAEACHANGSLLIMTVYPLALGILKTPGEMGVDIAVGEGQSLGLRLQYGGPYLGFIACRQNLIRRLPGRLVGETVDAQGNRGFVLTLQAREQHIKRERASSNICSNEAHCALQALAYLIVMGKRGFCQAAELCLQKAHYARMRLGAVPGASLVFDGPHFNEFVLRLRKPVMDLFRRLGHAFEPGIRLNRWYPELADCLLVAVTELNRKQDIDNYAMRLQDWLASG